MAQDRSVGAPVCCNMGAACAPLQTLKSMDLSKKQPVLETPIPALAGPGNAVATSAWSRGQGQQLSVLSAPPLSTTFLTLVEVSVNTAQSASDAWVPCGVARAVKKVPVTVPMIAS